MSPTSSLRVAPITSDFQSPRATARTAWVMRLSGLATWRDTKSVTAAKIRSETKVAKTSQRASERPSFSPIFTS